MGFYHSSLYNGYYRENGKEMETTIFIHRTVAMCNGWDRHQKHPSFRRGSLWSAGFINPVGFRVQGSGFRVWGLGFRV